MSATLRAAARWSWCAGAASSTSCSARHGTRAAAAYFLRQRGRDLDEVDGPARRAAGGADRGRRGRPGRLAARPRRARRPGPVPVRAGGRRRRRRAGRPGRQRGEVPRRAAGASASNPEPGPQPGRAGPAPPPTRSAALLPAVAAGRAPVRGAHDGRRPRSTTARSCSASTRSTSGTRRHQSARYVLGHAATGSGSGSRRPASSSAPAPARPAGAPRSRGSAPAPPTLPGAGRAGAVLVRPGGLAVAGDRRVADGRTAGRRASAWS